MIGHLINFNGSHDKERLSEVEKLREVNDKISALEGHIYKEAKIPISALVSRLNALEFELYRQSETIEQIFSSTPVCIAFLSTDGRFLRCNKHFCELLGYTERQILTKSFEEITHKDDIDADNALVQRVLSGKTDRYEMQKRYIHSSGRVVPVTLYVALVRSLGPEKAPLFFVSQVVQREDEKCQTSTMKNTDDS